MAEIPTVTQVRAWLKVTADDISDPALQQVIDAEAQDQARKCRWQPPPPADPVPYPAQLAQAVLRRVGRELAARGVPLGVSAADEFGSVRLPANDAEIARLEGTYRRVVFG